MEDIVAVFLVHQMRRIKATHLGTRCTGFLFVRNAQLSIFIKNIVKSFLVCQKVFFRLSDLVVTKGSTIEKDGHCPNGGGV